MKRILDKLLTGLIVAVIIFSPFSHSLAAERTDAMRHQNRLINEKSPYLLQHAGNPVDWYPWGPEAFSKGPKRKINLFFVHRIFHLPLVPRDGKGVF